MTIVKSGYLSASAATSGILVAGAKMVIGAFNSSQRFHNGGINGLLNQSPEAFPAGDRRTPRNPCSLTSFDKWSGFAGSSGSTRATPWKVLRYRFNTEAT